MHRQWLPGSLFPQPTQKRNRELGDKATLPISYFRPWYIPLCLSQSTVVLSCSFLFSLLCRWQWKLNNCMHMWKPTLRLFSLLCGLPLSVLCFTLLHFILFSTLSVSGLSLFSCLLLFSYLISFSYAVLYGYCTWMLLSNTCGAVHAALNTVWANTKQVTSTSRMSRLLLSNI